MKNRIKVQGTRVKKFRSEERRTVNTLSEKEKLI